MALNYDKYRMKDHTSADRSKRYRERLAGKRPPSGRKSGGLDGKPAGRRLKDLERASIAAAERGDMDEAERLNHAPLVPPGAVIIPPVMRVPGSGLPPMTPQAAPVEIDHGPDL